jgi:hypothetical protein
VVGRASSVLSARGAAAVALLAVLVVYYRLVGHLWDTSLWWDVAWLSFVLMPAVFALVYLVLPAWRAPVTQLLVLTVACGAVAIACELADVKIAANFAKLAAMTFLAFSFLTVFETLSWVVIVAAIIPVVDSYSVFAGPTKAITTHHENVYFAMSIAFPVPGHLGAANLGLPDLLFFAVFLAASARFGLRPFWTWLAMVGSFGGTIALAVGLSLNGLPALPFLSLAFLVANADLIWRQLRRTR